MSNVSVTFRGREVQNPLARKIVVAVLLMWMPVLFLIVGLAVTFIIVTLPVTLPIDWVLHRLERVGFSQNVRGHLSYNLSPQAFRKAR
jgi:hypothetical protein